MRIIRATSVQVLADGLAHQLATHPPDDPMAPIQVAVPGRGMERWLSQRLAVDLGATADEAGICANIDFVFPMSVVRRSMAAVLGDDPDAPDPWAPDRLVWPLLDHLDELPDDLSHAPLLAHLTDGAERATRRRFPLARRIADLFDRYALYRPEMVGGWSLGQDRDADGHDLPPNLAWQPILWRALRDRVAVPSPDDRFRAAVDALANGTIARPDALPDDVTIFGVLGLPPLQLRLLDALSRHVPVTIHTIAPVPAWAPGIPVTEVAHPLLASCGMAARDAHHALALHEPGAGDAVAQAGGVKAGDVEGDDAATALAVLQADIRADRPRGGEGAAPHPLAPGDRSIHAHECHGPMRQLEVLREVLLGLLEDDRTLEPRDIVVITPDITTWDPLIRAVFSDGDRPGDRARPGDDRDEDDGASGVPTLPYRVADRAVTEDNAVAQALLTVLELVTARVGASAVLDLLARAPVRDRFGLTVNDLADLPAWVLGTGISWGIDADHRQQLIDLDDASHTWQAGLDRLVLGAAMPDDGTRMVAGVVPYDDVEGSAVELLGKLTGATDALFTSLRSLRDPRPVDDWRQALDQVVDTLLDPGPQRDGELTAQLAAVRQALADMVDDSQRPDGTPSPVVLTLEEVRSLVASKLGRGGGRTTFGTGAITFAGLVPLRNVPFRVVCLVGMDDGAIPRSGMRHGFDLVAADPRPGDPDPRVEDRQLLLDAILSAGDHLVITWTGNDPRTNEVQQPAVPISELLDVLADSLVVEATVAEPAAVEAAAVEAAPSDAAGSDRASMRDAVRRRLVTSHPLQPHSARYFRDPQGDEARVPPAFDRRQLAAARTAAGERAPASTFFPRALPPPTEEEVDPVVVDLDELVRFLENPVKHLLQRRVGIALGDDDPRLEDRDPTELDGLDRWRLGRDLLDLQLADTSPDRWRELVMATGTVPVGGLGEVALDGVQDLTRSLVERVRQVPGEHRSVAIDITVPVPDQAVPRRVVGSVDMVGSTVLDVTVSRDRKKRRLPLWVRLLAATASGEERPEGLLLTQHDKKRTEIGQVTLHPVADLLAELHPGTGGGRDEGGSDDTLGEVIDGATRGANAANAADAARALLGDLVALYLRGMVAPVPVLPETGCAYAAAILDDGDPATALRAARTAWENTWNRMGECFDTYVCQAFGTEPALDMLTADGTFQRDATLLWLPIVIAERGPAEVVS